jgi:hypothetical protein
VSLLTASGEFGGDPQKALRIPQWISPGGTIRVILTASIDPGTWLAQDAIAVLRVAITKLQETKRATFELALLIRRAQDR